MSSNSQDGVPGPRAGRPGGFVSAGLSVGWWRALGGRLRVTLQVLALMEEVRRERRAMATLSYRDFSDMGIDTGSALAESERGMFDLPTDRLREALR